MKQAQYIYVGSVKFRQNLTIYLSDKFLAGKSEKYE